MSAAKAEAQTPSILEAWQRHVLDCKACSSARDATELCQMGKNFWRLPGSATLPVPGPVQAPTEQPASVAPAILASPAAPAASAAPAAPAVSAAPHVAVSVNLAPQSPAFDLNALAARVTESVVARASSGAAIAVPTEKTSRAVSVATGPGVVLHMPERDIEVYSIMKMAIGKLLRLAEMMGTALLSVEEANRMAREGGVTINERDVALVVRKVSEARGLGAITAEGLYGEFAEVRTIMLRLGDVMGRFMTVDSETRTVMREVRALGVEMQGEIERAAGGKLVLDADSRRITRGLRMVAVSLQGEMERRLGT